MEYNYIKVCRGFSSVIKINFFIFLLYGFHVNAFSNNIIKVSKWKYGSKSAINFSFDDVLVTHNDISKIFDKYNFKATFFVNFAATTILKDAYLDIYRRGHEIGNHTYTHKDITAIGRDDIIYEKAIGRPEKKFGVYSFELSPYKKTGILAQFILL